MNFLSRRMPTKTPIKRTARMTTLPSSTKRRAAIEKRQRAATLITGGTGFLGSHLVRQLIQEGSRDIRVMATSIPDWLINLGVETFEGSITNAEDVKRAVEGIRDVYHLAGKVSRGEKRFPRDVRNSCGRHEIALRRCEGCRCKDGCRGVDQWDVGGHE
jgi:hypothetical protein